MVITPTAGRQAFDFEMRIGRKSLCPSFVDVAVVIKYPQRWKPLENNAANVLSKLLVHSFIIDEPIGWLQRIKPMGVHTFDACVADAIMRADDVEEQALRWITLCNLDRLAKHIVAVTFVVEADRVPSRA